MSGRVNGVLAVTRSLGDSSMKEFVVGSPYTTETELCEEDEFLILACDGVRQLLLSFPFYLSSDAPFSSGTLFRTKRLSLLCAISKTLKLLVKSSLNTL